VLNAMYCILGAPTSKLGGGRDKHLAPDLIGWQAGAQPALHFGGRNFHEISLFDDVIVLIQPWYNFFANGHI